MLWIRVAQGAIALFALGHSVGMLNATFRDEHERAAIEGLKSYVFDIMGVQRTHWDFYQGMGWSLSLFLILLLVLLNFSIPIARANPDLVRPIWYACGVAMLVMTAFCVRWFFPAPLVMSAVAGIALIVGAWRLKGLV
jgi:hypothetical protein